MFTTSPLKCWSYSPSCWSAKQIALVNFWKGNTVRCFGTNLCCGFLYRSRMRRTSIILTKSDCSCGVVWLTYQRSWFSSNSRWHLRRWKVGQKRNHGPPNVATAFVPPNLQTPRTTNPKSRHYLQRIQNDGSIYMWNLTCPCCSNIRPKVRYNQANVDISKWVNQRTAFVHLEGVYHFLRPVWRYSYDMIQSPREHTPNGAGHGGARRWSNNIYQYVVLFSLKGECACQACDRSLCCRVLDQYEGSTMSGGKSYYWHLPGRNCHLHKSAINSCFTNGGYRNVHSQIPTWEHVVTMRPNFCCWNIGQTAFAHWSVMRAPHYER